MGEGPLLGGGAGFVRAGLASDRMAGIKPDREEWKRGREIRTTGQSSSGGRRSWILGRDDPYQSAFYGVNS